jgi:mannosyltransferase OCH1-like enzyme
VIPKTIHYVWFSKEIPEKVQRYIDGWQRVMPDYEFKKWNADNFDVNSVKWVKQAVEVKKWAFATDYIRLWALYNYGGIYLDCDVECLKSFDDILHLPYFLGREHSKGIIEMAVLGSEPKCEWVKECLDYYDDRDFISQNSKFSMEPIPHIMLKILGTKYGLKRIKNVQGFNKKSKEIQILPVEFFSPKPFDSENFSVTNNTYTVHYFEKSWEPQRKWHSLISRYIKHYIRKIIGEKRYSNFMWFVYADR